MLMSINTEKPKRLPDTPGVYFFLGPKTRKATSYGKLSTGLKGRRILYIGKAGSLRDRVRSYFSKDIISSRGSGIEKMIENAEDIAYEKTDSVLEAVLLEAELIKKYQPKYNVKEKDDKSFNFVVITAEDFPRVRLIRGHELEFHTYGPKTKDYQPKVDRPMADKLKTIFGPFPQAGTLREALSIIRKIFPHRDRCVPIPVRRGLTGVYPQTNKPCFNRQIGLCPGVCTGEISKKEYAKTIRNIVLLFKGKKKSIITKLTHEMKSAAKEHAFEHATELRNTIFALEHIQDVSLIKREPHFGEIESGRIRRIEAYDVAHTSGKEMVGVMVTIYSGEPDKKAYKKFKLRTIFASNDTGALKEILERRLAHAEWPFPDLVVVDGGKAQVNIAERILNEAGLPVLVVGVVKDDRHKPKNILGDKKIRERFEDEILLANSEAHRFAIGYHRERMRKR